MRDRGVNGRASPWPCPDDDDVTEARASREGLPLALLVAGLTEDMDDDGAVADRVSSTNFPLLMLWLLSGWARAAAMMLVLPALPTLPLMLLLFSLGDSGCLIAVDDDDDDDDVWPLAWL